MIERLEMEVSNASVSAGMLRPGTLLRIGHTVREVFRSKRRCGLGDRDGALYIVWVKPHSTA